MRHYRASNPQLCWPLARARPVHTCRGARLPSLGAGGVGGAACALLGLRSTGGGNASMPTGALIAGCQSNHHCSPYAGTSVQTSGSCVQMPSRRPAKFAGSALPWSACSPSLHTPARTWRPRSPWPACAEKMAIKQQLRHTDYHHRAQPAGVQAPPIGTITIAEASRQAHLLVFGLSRPLGLQVQAAGNVLDTSWLAVQLN